jgi:hypothetical protein
VFFGSSSQITFSAFFCEKSFPYAVQHTVVTPGQSVQPHTGNRSATAPPSVGRREWGPTFSSNLVDPVLIYGSFSPCQDFLVLVIWFLLFLSDNVRRKGQGCIWSPLGLR